MIPLTDDKVVLISRWEGVMHNEKKRKQGVGG